MVKVVGLSREVITSGELQNNSSLSTADTTTRIAIIIQIVLPVELKVMLFIIIPCNNMLPAMNIIKKDG